MATKTKNKYVGTGSAGNNDGARRAKAAKEGKCQWCQTKVPLEEQFVVFNDFEKEKTIKSKNAAKPGREKLSHYCDDCATKRQKIKQAGDFDKATNGGKRGRTKGSGKGKKAVAKKAPAKKSPAKKKAVTKKTKGASSAKKGGEKKRVVRRKKGAAKSAEATKSDPF